MTIHLAWWYLPVALVVLGVILSRVFDDRDETLIGGACFLTGFVGALGIVVGHYL